MMWTKEQTAQALQRLLSQTCLPEARVRQVLTDTPVASRNPAAFRKPRPSCACHHDGHQLLWTEEKEEGLRSK